MASVHREKYGGAGRGGGAWQGRKIAAGASVAPVLFAIPSAAQ